MAASAWYEVQKAIDGRLIGDATLVALLGTASSASIYNTESKAAASGMFPYLVVRWGDPVPDDGFTINHDVIDFSVKAYVEMDTKYGSDTYLARIDLILKRIKGDWEEQVTRVPSYGLDRYAPGALASTGFTATECRRTLGPVLVQDDGIYQRNIDFEVHVSKTGA